VPSVTVRDARIRRHRRVRAKVHGTAERPRLVVSRSNRGIVAQLVDEVVQYEDVYRLCYVRGPEGILVGLAEQIEAQRAEL